VTRRSSTTTESEKGEGWSVARFFLAYQQFDAQTAPEDAPALTLDERHLAAAYAAGAGAAEPGTHLTIDVRGNSLDFTVTPPPFYKRPGR
jgi:hypothetical protein